MKTIIYTLIFLEAVSFTANAQSKIADYKQKNNFIMHMHQNQILKSPAQNFGLKINSYWEDVNAPHVINNSHVVQIQVPSPNAVWAHVDFDTTVYIANQFIRTADGGRTWRIDSVDAPNGYGLSSIAGIDANTCYAAMYDAFNYGGAMFKTIDGGNTWKQVQPGKVYSANSFPDFVYFFDAQHGLSVGDDDLVDTSRLEIYTTSDAGKTWQRVPDKNLPPTQGYAFSTNFNPYAFFENRFWFTAGDTYGNNYIYRSDDFGQHWQQFPYTATSFNAFSFSDKKNGLGVGLNFGVGSYEVETHDGGKTWSDKNFTGYPMGLFLTVIPYTHTFVSTMPYGLAPVSGSSYSNDGGATWKLINTSSDFQPFALAFLNPLIGWCGRADSPDPNGGMYKWKYHFSLDNNSLITNDANVSLIEKNNLNNTINARLYPNPVKDVITVNGLNASVKTTLSLFNISGKLIQQAIANSANYSFSIQKLAAGNYYITIESNKQFTTLKFVKE
ncbi:MAG: T9SS type A sorting domain-containing protein [Parafilimonas sp.]